MDIFWMLLLQLVLIGLNAIFACAEIAVLGISDTKLNKLASDGDKRAKRLARLTKQPARFLSTIQVAITLSGFLGSAFAAENFSEPLAAWAITLGAPAKFYETYETVALIVVTLILSYITLIFGELVPKRVAQRKAEKVALGLSSTAFAVHSEGENVTITTLGYGHGVGLCQYGADGMAQRGARFTDILSHYYPGTQLRQLY